MYFQVPDPAVPVPALHDPRLEGEWHMFFDCHFDANLAGPWNGTFYVDLVFEGEPGGWTGTFQGVCFGGAGALGGDAYLNAKGYGCFEGLKFKAYMLNPGDGGVRPIDGYIHDPQGE